MRPLTLLGLATIWFASSLAYPTQGTSDGSHRRRDIFLERRADQFHPRRLSLEEFYEKSRQADMQVREAASRDPTLWARVTTVLGISSDQPTELATAELNNALRQAGYKGALFPDNDELEEYTHNELEQFFNQRERASQIIERTSQRDPSFIRRLRLALGLDPEGPFPEPPIAPRAYNKALREAGYTGPLLPEDPKRPRSDQGGGSGNGGPPNRGFGGPQSSSGRDKFSFNEGPPQSGYLSTAVQFLRGSLSKKFSDVVRSMPNTARSPSQPRPLLPIKGPYGPLIPI